MIKLIVISFGGKATLIAHGIEGKLTCHHVMTLRREEKNLNKGRFSNFLPLPHDLSDKKLLKYSMYVTSHTFSYVAEWADNTEGKWFVEFTDHTNPEYFKIHFELQEDVLLFRMMFPECL